MEGLRTIRDAARELGLPASTIRYYDKRGLLPHIGRTEGGIRTFTEDDLEWIRFVEILKASGMPLGEIKEYIDLSSQGDSTIEQRRKMVHDRRDRINHQIAELELELARDYIDYKCWFYDVASEAGTCDVPRDMSPDEMPPRIRAIRERCRINRY